MYGGLQEEAVGDQAALSTTWRPRELPREEGPVRASTRALRDAPAAGTWPAHLGPSHALSTRRSSGRSHSFSPSGQVGMAPEGSSGLTGWASWSSSRPAAAPGRSCWATAVLRSPLGLPREKGCWGHLGLGAVREPSHRPLEGSASCPVTFLQSRGPAHGLDCPALLPSSTQAPPHMTPSQPLCVRPCPWGRDAHLLGSVGWGSQVDRSLRVELRALEAMGWSGCPPPNACSKGGWRPRSWRGFSGRGAVGWSPFLLPGPHRAVERSCRPPPRHSWTQSHR